MARYDLDELAMLLRDTVPDFMPATVVAPPSTVSENATVVAFPARNVRKT